MRQMNIVSQGCKGISPLYLNNFIVRHPTPY
jgi:hypothetical protein